MESTNNTNVLEKLEQVKADFMAFYEETLRFYSKGVKASAARSRKAAQTLKKQLQEFRLNVSAHLKTLPKKDKKS